MNRKLRGSGILVGVILLLAANSLPAQDRPLFPGQNNTSQSNSDALSLLLDQNNGLRAELQALRAIVEEQGFELRRLQRDSLSRYTNMDERLQALESSAAMPATVPNSATATGEPAATGANPVSSLGDLPSRPPPQPAETEPSPASPAISSAPISSIPQNPAPQNPGPQNPGPQNAGTDSQQPSPPARNRASTLQPAVLSEQQLYQMAYESAINSDFERSIAEFDQYLSVYPEGRFVDNAHYWKGQSYLYLDRYDEAREAYEIILNEYVDSAKLPDAMYGLGQAWQGLGDTRRARELFNNIKRRYPNTGVANLADTRLLSLD